MESMTKKVKKNITLDDLAGMVKSGFDGVEKRFDKIETRLGGLENGTEEIKLKLDQVAYRFEIEELDRRLKRVEAKMGIK
jgi:archaellum component FlaC